MDVYWLEQSEEDLPEENNWLCPSEISFLDSLRFAKRRADWRLGRWTAKRALAAYLSLPSSSSTLAKIEVRPAPSGAPEAIVEDKPAAATISLSHRKGRAICTVAPPSVHLGCDLEVIEPHSDAFISDYLAAEEQALVMRQSVADRPLFLAVLWSGKESALKALRTGLRLDTRAVIVGPVDLSFDRYGWSPLRVYYIGGEIFYGWWQTADGMVRSVVAVPPPGSPIPLRVASYVSEGVARSEVREREHIEVVPVEDL
jgi:4'-phosphopantetheinyl transferase